MFDEAILPLSRLYQATDSARVENSASLQSRKNHSHRFMKSILILLMTFLMATSLCAADLTPEKRKEIEKMLRLTGMEKLMDQMKTQMLSSFRTEIKEVPEVFWTKFEQKMDMRELIEKIIPLYDKYYTLEDLKAVNAFYESPAGKRVLSTLPQIMQEAMLIGNEWGRKTADLAVQEAQRELAEQKENE